jgi:hypothetical protein
MDEPQQLPVSPPEAVPAPTTSLAARLLNVFAVPGDVFAEVKVAPESVANWLVPMLLLLVVGLCSAWLIFSQPPIQQQLREQQDEMIQKLVKKGWLTQEAADTQRRVSGNTTKFAPYLGAVVQAVATPFCWGFILWLVGVKALKGSFSFMKAVEVVGLASTITCLGTVVSTLMVVGLGNLFASPSPALLLKHFDPQKPSDTMLAVFNVMTFWVLSVRAIGLARLAGVPAMKAAFWVFGIWLAYTSFFFGCGLALRAAFGF